MLYNKYLSFSAPTKWGKGLMDNENLEREKSLAIEAHKSEQAHGLSKGSGTSFLEQAKRKYRCLVKSMCIT